MGSFNSTPKLSVLVIDERLFTEKFYVTSDTLCGRGALDGCESPTISFSWFEIAPASFRSKTDTISEIIRGKTHLQGYA